MENLLARLEDALNSGQPESIREALTRIGFEMDVHFACEEQALFPAVTPYHPMILMEAEHENHGASPDVDRHFGERFCFQG